MVRQVVEDAVHGNRASVLSILLLAVPGVVILFVLNLNAMAHKLLGDVVSMSATWASIGNVASFGAFLSFVTSPIAVILLALRWRSLTKHQRQLLVGCVVLTMLGTLQFFLGASLITMK